MATRLAGLSLFRAGLDSSDGARRRRSLGVAVAATRHFTSLPPRDYFQRGDRIVDVLVSDFGTKSTRALVASTVLMANPSGHHYLVLGEGTRKVYGAYIRRPLRLLSPPESKSEVLAKAEEFLSQ